MKPLFFVGNRRSGTSMMTMILNEHRQIYMCMEADTLWYLFSGGNKGQHPDDAVMELHLKKDGLQSEDSRELNDLLTHSSLDGSDREKFFQDLIYLKDNGIKNRQTAYLNKSTEELVWVGDKKPHVPTDPDMKPWISEHFPDAKHIHIVRDPRDSIGSMLKHGWGNGDVELLTNYWIRLEHQALEVEDRILLRFEEVSVDPFGALINISKYLGLDPRLIRGVEYLEEMVVPETGYTVIPGFSSSKGSRANVPVTPGMKELMKIYGY